MSMNLMETILPLAVFAFITSVTPGPNNLLLLNSGVRFGFRRSLRHILGIQFGFAVQLALCAYGVGVLLMSVPAVGWLLKLFGTAYLLYLAWNLRINKIEDGSGSNNRPFSFLHAALFQFINPKAWIMTITAGSLFLPPADSQIVSIALLCLVFGIVGAPSSGSWAIIGVVIKRYLADPFWQRWYSRTMVVLTIYTAVAIWLF